MAPHLVLGLLILMAIAAVGFWLYFNSNQVPEPSPVCNSDRSLYSYYKMKEAIDEKAVNDVTEKLLTTSSKDEEPLRDTESPKTPNKPKKKLDKKKLKEKLKKAKLTKEERRKKQEEEEIREEAKKYEEERQRLKLREKRILEAKVSVEERRRLENLEKLKQQDLERRKQYDEKQRLLAEEEERKNPKPVKAPPKPAWNVVKHKEQETVNLKDILREELKSENCKTEEEAEQERLLKYRRERRNHRKILAKQEALQKVAFEQKTQSNPREKKEPENDTTAKIQALVTTEKRKMAWEDPTKITYSSTGACKIAGIPTELHSALLGEKGYNAKLFKKLNVAITVPFDDTPVILQGKQDDIDIATQKLNCFLKWKHFQSVAKQQAQLRAQYRDEAAGPQHRDQINELLDKEKLHSLLVDAAYAEAKRNCTLFYNQGMGPNRIDLHGLRLEDAFLLLKMRIEQIEAMTAPPFNTIDIYFPKSTSGLTREITDYLKHYQFQFELSSKEDCIIVNV